MLLVFSRRCIDRSRLRLNVLRSQPGGIAGGAHGRTAAHCCLTTFLVLAALVAGPMANAGAAEPSGPKVSFNRQIRPIFQAHCQGCHQPAKRGGDYEMTSFASLLEGGESGEAAIVAGKPDASFLLAQITPENGEAAMPQDKPPLSLTDIALIERWILQGAADDTPLSDQPMYDAQHPPVYPAAPVITSLDYSPDGKWLAVSGYHEVLLHRADGSGLAARLVGQSERIESAVFSPDSKWLAMAGGSPGRLGEVQVWNVETHELAFSVPVGFDTCYGCSWSPDGKLIGFGCPDNTLRAIEASTGKQVLFSGAHAGWVLDTVFSVKGTHLISVSRDRSMKLIEVATERFVDNITSITPGALKGGLNAVDRNPKNDELLIGGADGAPKIYRMFREKARKIGDDFNLIRAFAPLPGRIFDVAFGPQGKQIAAGSSFNGTGEVRVYQAADGKKVFEVKIEQGGVYAVAFSPDGKTLAAGGYSGEVVLIATADGKVLKRFIPVTIEAKKVAATGE